MPLTPFHLGPGLFLGTLTKKINILAILLGSVLMDLEPFVLIFVKRCYYCHHHGFWHSILGATIGSLALAVILSLFKGRLNKLSLKFKIQQSYSFIALFLGSLVGWLTHILIDSFTHYDVFLFWPLRKNFLLIGPEIYWSLNFILAIFGILGLIIFIKNLKQKDVRY